MIFLSYVTSQTYLHGRIRRRTLRAVQRQLALENSETWRWHGGKGRHRQMSAKSAKRPLIKGATAPQRDSWRFLIPLFAAYRYGTR